MQFSVMASGPSASSEAGKADRDQLFPCWEQTLPRCYRGRYFLVIGPGKSLPLPGMKVQRKGTGLGAQQAWVQIPALPHPCQEPLGPLCQLPVQWGE